MVELLASGSISSEIYQVVMLTAPIKILPPFYCSYEHRIELKYMCYHYSFIHLSVWLRHTLKSSSVPQLETLSILSDMIRFVTCLWLYAYMELYLCFTPDVVTNKTLYLPRWKCQRHLTASHQHIRYSHSHSHNLVDLWHFTAHHSFTNTTPAAGLSNAKS